MDGSSEKTKEDELLVFGYACKLFRDDEKALLIDSGKHLIPWMADGNLKIDRYDGRGALSDLRPHEPPPGGFDRWHGLTDRERKLEEMVDQERYMALYKDEDEERMLEEEEWKRLQSLAGDKGRYNQIGFSYDAPGPAAAGDATAAAAAAAAAGTGTGTAAASQADDEPYEPAAALSVPVGMVQPTGRRHADIIERTAHFVARQGPQMEILIKAKQSENPMFDFLAFDDPLQPFFRHMVVMIKAGRYAIGPPKQEEEDESYLHPALNLSRPDIAPGKADVMYQPSANCAYQRLVKNIRSSRQAADSPTPPSTPAPAAGGGSADSPAGAGAGRDREASPAPAARPPAPAPAPAALPPPDVKLIIDKMASYVAKNGRDFEGIVMGRGDERFSFLKDTHQHNAYYRQKLEQYERNLGKSKPAAAVAPATEGTTAAPAAAESAESKANKPVPVSFSIRPKSEKDSAPLERSALPLEESEEEGEEGAQPAAAAAAGAAGAAAETNGDTRQEKAATVAVAAPVAPSRAEPAKKPSRQAPIVAPAPGVGRDEIQLDRKRRAAQFLAKLRQDVDKVKQPVIGPQLPPGPLPTGSGSDSSDSDSDGGAAVGGTPPPGDGRSSPTPPPPQQQQQQQREVEKQEKYDEDDDEEESDDDADLDKYKLVDSDSPHSVPELGSDDGSAAAAGPTVRPDSPAPPSGSGSDSDRRRSDSKRGSRDASESKRSGGDGAGSRRHSRDPSVSKRSSRDPSVSKRSARGASERGERRERSGSGRRVSEEREERRRRHRHKKRSSHHHRRRRRERRERRLDGGSDSEVAARSVSRSPSHSRSPRRHKKRRKRSRSPPASYKRLQSPVAVSTAPQPHWRRSARREQSRSPVRSKRRRSHSSRPHKHKSKKRKRSKRSRSRSGSRSARVPEVTEVTLSPERPAALPGDIIDLTGADSPERRQSGSDHASQSPAVQSDRQPAPDSRASTSRGASPTPVPSAVWSPAGSGSGSQSRSRSRPRSAASSRSGSPASPGRGSSDSDSERGDLRPSASSIRDEEARRTSEAIAQLKRKLVRRSTPTTNGGGAAASAARPAPATGHQSAERSSSALVAQMAEGLKAKVHEMMKGSLLGK